MKQYDAIIIGFGKGGKTLATKMAKLNLHVAMIEKSKTMYGGTCINEGCIPSKSLISQAGKINYSDAINNKENLISQLRAKNYHKLNNLDNIDVIDGEAVFEDEHHVRIIENNEVIEGDLIFINTGSQAVIPDIKGAKSTKHVYTSATLMKETKLPQRLAIIGGGYIGLEFASMYARYGSQVTVFESHDQLIKREDRDVALEIQNILEQQGVKFIFDSHVFQLDNLGEQVVVSYNEQEMIFDGILLATGRRANTASLQLDKAGVKSNERGEIMTNEYLQTSKRHIFALGDVKGGLQFTYISLDDYRIVYDYLFGDKQRTIDNRGAIPYSVFISPTFSRIGLSEMEARHSNMDIIVKKMDVVNIPKAHVLKKTEGMLKIIIDKETELILGAVLICEYSEELINMIALIMNHRLSYHVLKDHIYTHPTMSEAFNDLLDI